MERTYICGTCRQTVPFGHFHESDTRVCEDCRQELPIGGFPKWQSAFDGHRKQCFACTNARNRKHADDQRVARQASRDEENRLLSEHGYRWHLASSTGRRPGNSLTRKVRLSRSKRL